MLAKVTRVPLQALLDVRMLISLVFLVAVTVFYLAVVAPLATVASPGGYRLPFTVEAIIYAVFFGLFFVHFSYRLLRPASVPEEAEGAPRWHLAGALTLRPLFFLVVGGAYLTGAMIYSPHLFEVVSGVFATPVVPFAISLHAIFGFLIMITGVALVIFETASAFLRNRVRDWLFKGRYLGIKALYWVLAIVVVIQAITGILLLGAFSPWGPFGSVPFMSLSVEQLVRSLHGPLGAVVFAVFVGHIYLRLRPEYRIR